MKTVNDSQLVSRPSALCKVATDWFIGGCLQWCLMYSRNFFLEVLPFQVPRLSVNPFFGMKVQELHNELFVCFVIKKLANVILGSYSNYKFS